MSTYESDKGAILRLHKDWWEANNGLDIALMRTAFPAGDAYLMFNLNGHPYFGIEEKTTLWEYYSTRLIVGLSDVRILRLDIGADMAYIACEGLFPVTFLDLDEDGNPIPRGNSGDGWQAEQPIRATEIYKRDDGAGEPVWKMWHFHATPLPAADEPRPAFDDTYASRGLGYIPGHDYLSVVGE
jgi:hypothetical protein